MKAYIYLHVSLDDRYILLEKINELGYKADNYIKGDTFQVYLVEMSLNDLVMLKLSIPSLEISLRDS
jgi:hypothetical protein